MKDHYNLYIFDFDGTLADSGLGIAHAIQQFSKQKGLPIYTERQILDAVGHGVDQLLSTLFPMEEFDTRKKFEFIEEFIEVYRVNQKEKTFLYPEVEQILNEIVDSGSKIAIVSNKPEDLLSDVIESLGLNSLPWVKIAGAETYAKPKPDGLPLVEVMKLAGVEASNTVMVGDSDADCLAAKNAGSDFLGCTFGIGSKDLINRFPNEALMNEFREIRKWI